MRLPSEYLPAAMARLRGSLIPDCSVVMRHGDVSANVTRVGGTSRGADGVTGTSVNENAKVLASASDFPELRIGSAVEVEDSLRVVVSLDADITRTILNVGLSSAFEEVPAAYAGTRRENGVARQLRFPVELLAVEDSSLPAAYADAVAPIIVQSWTCCIAVDTWPENTPPQTGDTITFTDTRNGSGEEMRLKVSRAVRENGWWILTARPREA